MTMDTFNVFLRRWMTPTTLLAMIGGIIWGVQLTMVVLSHEKNIASNGIKIEYLVRESHQVNLTLVKITAVLDSVVGRLARIEQVQRDHELDCREWKRKITENEIKLNGNNHRGTP